VNVLEFFEFAGMFQLPLFVGAVAVGAALGLVFRDDSDRVEWPREDQ
jgi:hypothetical protein